MTFSLSAEISATLIALSEEFGEMAPVVAGDLRMRRKAYEELQRPIHDRLPMPLDVTMADFYVDTADGAQILVRWYSRAGAAPGSAVLYIHGGGMISGSVEIYDAPVATYVSRTGVPFLSVDYRLAPDAQAPTPVADCYAALQWLVVNASQLGVDVDRIAVMGDSAGGGIAACLAVYARDHAGPAIAKQILIYPMLDDRNTTPDDELTSFAAWTYDQNAISWRALVGDKLGGKHVDAYAAAARLSDFSGLPASYLEVGELDIFRDETIRFAQGLLAAAVSTELHVHPAVPHGYDAFAPHADVSRRALHDRHRVVQEL